MTRGSVLIVTWDGGGNVPPAVALAARLAARGHRVRVVGPPWIARRVSDAGAELVPYRAVDPLPPTERHEANWDRIDDMLNGPAMTAELRACLRADPADVLVADSLMGAALAAGEAEGVPTAVLVHTLYRSYRDWGPMVANVKTTRAAAGLLPVPAERFAADVLDRAALVLACVPPGFDAPGDLSDNTRYVGPILNLGPAPRVAIPAGLTSPAVLISFGSTVQRQREALGPVLEALAGSRVHGVLTLGGVLGAGSVMVPPNVSLMDYVPHAALLPAVDAVVCHGGLSTLMASFSAGRPVVVIPQGRDQHENAERVADVGAGIALPTDSPARVIREAIEEVLDEPRFAAAARRIAEQVTALGGGSLAADLVEDLVARPARARTRALGAA